MRRRGVGVGAVKRTQQTKKQFEEVGNQLASDQLNHVNDQLSVFKTKLEQFAMKYKSSIKKDPEFRKRFQIMCSKIGVDPLASNKGFWSELLDFGDFYYELAVQIIEVCILTRNKNGGLIRLSDLLRILRVKRGSRMQKISDDDVRRAVKKLRLLGEGFNLVELGGESMVITVPVELSSDHSTILSLAQETGYITILQLENQLQWNKHRSEIALTTLLREGMAWIDTQATDKQTIYYFPSISLGNAITE